MIHPSHKFRSSGVTGLRWLTFCLRCGLVALKNIRTSNAMRAKCPGADE